MSAAAQQAGTIERPGGLKRKELQCWNNCMAVLRLHSLTSVIIRTRKDGVREDRVEFDCVASAERVIDSCAGFKRRAIHQNHGKSAVRSWQERCGSASMQITLHYAGGFYLEVDFDEANPGWDLVSLFRHGFEVSYHWLSGHKTNPFVIAAARGLARV